MDASHDVDVVVCDHGQPATNVAHDDGDHHNQAQF